MKTKLILFLSLIIQISYSGDNMNYEIKPGKYRHYSGKEYEVIGQARYSENPEKIFVIYKQLYESQIRGTDKKLPIGTIWARPIEMFEELVEVDGKKIPRFKKVD